MNFSDPKGRRGPGIAKVWLDDDGCFRFGKHQGEFAEDIAREEPSYIRWALSEAEDMIEEDRETLEDLLYWIGDR